MRPRVVTVEFINDEGLRLAEDYYFPDAETLVGWLELVDDDMIYGGHCEMRIRYLGVPAQRKKQPEREPATKARRTPAKRAPAKAERKPVKAPRKRA